MADEKFISAVDEVSLGSLEEPSTDSLSGDPGTVARQPTGCLTDTESTDNRPADDGSPDNRPADNRSPDDGSADNVSTDNRPADTGSADTGSADNGSADNGSADIRSADTRFPDNGSADNGSADIRSADNGSPDNRPEDNGLPDNGSADNRSADDESPDNVSTDNRPADTGSADNGSADIRSADTGSPDNGSADNGSADIRSADNGLPDNGSADNRSADDESPDNVSTDNRPADTGSAGTGSADTGSADIRSPDTGSPDNGSEDNGLPNNGSADNRLPDNGSADIRSADNRSADYGSADYGSPDNRSAENRSPDNRSADNRLPDNGSAENRSADNRSADYGSPDDGSPDNRSAENRSADNRSAESVPSMDEPPVNKSVSESRDTSPADIRSLTDESVTPGESGGGSVDYDSTVDWSPILFRALDETDDDTVTDTETVDGARPTFGAFGASLATQKLKNGHYCHRLHQVEEGVCNKLRSGDELRYINKTDVSSWNHHEVLESIRHLRERVTFTFYRKYEVFETGNMMRTEDTFVEITFIITDQDSDGKAPTLDKVFTHIIDVTYKFSKMIRYNSSLAVMKYLGKTCVKVAHGVGTHHFLRVLGNRAVMEQQRGQLECYKFWMYSYAVKDSKDDKGKSVVAFQSVRCQLFLMCNMTSKKLSMVKKNIDSNLRIMKSNSPCLFLLSSNGSNDSFLESVAYDGLFLGYDAVDELELNRLHRGDMASARVRANFSFHITPTTP